jgi:acetyl-CoA acetyltransferase
VPFKLGPNGHADEDLLGRAVDHVGGEAKSFLLHQLDNCDVVGNGHCGVVGMFIRRVTEHRSPSTRRVVCRRTAAVGTSEGEWEDPSAAGLAPGDPEQPRRTTCPELTVELVERRKDAGRELGHASTVEFRRVSDIVEQGAIISGIGISRIGRKTGIPGLELTLESSSEAIADAGLTSADIDGIATMGETPVADAATRLGIEHTWTGSPVGRWGLLSPVVNAFGAVATGQARHVLVYRTVNMMGGSVMPQPAASGNAASAPAPLSDHRPSPPVEERGNPMADVPRLLAAHAYSAANWLALHARRHMYLYGTTKEQLGWLAINSRRNAALNPRATYRDPLAMEDYLSARIISDPFGLLDCDVPVDGSVAFVVSTVDAVDDCDHPVRVEACGGALGLGGWDQRSDYPKMASTDAAAEMWSRTDLEPADVDIAELYDGFTFLTFAWLEALGFCGEGEAGPFVEGAARIALDGQLPLNTYGGQLSAGRMHGNWVLHEACLQLRGEAGPRQVQKRDVAAVSNGGGPIAGCMLLTR